jgi:hypothetical protein
MTVLALALAGCGMTRTASTFGEVAIVLEQPVGANAAGVYFAIARGYDSAEGVTLQPAAEGRFRLVERPPDGCEPVLPVVRPDRLVLCVDDAVLREERPKVVAVVRALMRGYTQAQREPDEAAAAMVAEVPELDEGALRSELDEAAPAWTAGAAYFGEGTSVSAEAHAQ